MQVLQILLEMMLIGRGRQYQLEATAHIVMCITQTEYTRAIIIGFHMLCISILCNKRPGGVKHTNKRNTNQPKTVFFVVRGGWG